MTVARDKNEGTLYTTTNTKDYTVISKAKCDVELWHYRFGHMSEHGTKEL